MKRAKNLLLIVVVLLSNVVPSDAAVAAPAVPILSARAYPQGCKTVNGVTYTDVYVLFNISGGVAAFSVTAPTNAVRLASARVDPRREGRYWAFRVQFDVVYGGAVNVNIKDGAGKTWVWTVDFPGSAAGGLKKGSCNSAPFNIWGPYSK